MTYSLLNTIKIFDYLLMWLSKCTWDGTCYLTEFCKIVSLNNIHIWYTHFGVNLFQLRFNKTSWDQSPDLINFLNFLPAVGEIKLLFCSINFSMTYQEFFFYHGDFKDRVVSGKGLCTTFSFAFEKKNTSPEGKTSCLHAWYYICLYIFLDLESILG